MEKKRIPHIDLLESIAIFFVIMYHCTLYSFDFTQNKTALNFALYFGRTILSTCVPLFFFANGYLLLNQKFDLKKHIKKILKLVLLVFIWAFILMPLHMIIAGEPLRIKTIMLGILNKDIHWSMNLFWFLGALICIYIVFPALKALFDTNKKGFVFFTAVCAFFTFGYILSKQVLSFAANNLNFNFTRVLDYPFITMFNPFRGIRGYSFVYFCFGGLVYHYEEKILSVTKRTRNTVAIIGILINCLLLFLVGVYFSIYSNTLWDVVWNGYNTIFTFFNVFFIYILCLNYTKNYSFIICISKNTLGIYFTHELIKRLTFPYISSQAYLSNLPFNILYSFFVMCICVLLCILIKKIPIIKMLVQ